MLHIGTWAATIFLILGTVLFFVIALINRQSNNFGLAFNPLFGYVSGIGLYAIIGWLFSVKIGLLLGFVAGLVLGFVGGSMAGGDDGG